MSLGDWARQVVINTRFWKEEAPRVSEVLCWALGMSLCRSQPLPLRCSLASIDEIRIQTFFCNGVVWTPRTGGGEPPRQSEIPVALGERITSSGRQAGGERDSQNLFLHLHFENKKNRFLPGGRAV